MSVNKIRLLSASASIYIEGGTSVLFIDGSKELVQLSPLATIILLSCDSFESQESTLKHLAVSLKLSLDRIHRDFEQLKSLLTLESKSTESYTLSQYPELSIKPPVDIIDISEKPHACYLKVAGSSFKIACDNVELQNDICRLLNPIAVESNFPDFVLTISLKDNDKYKLESNGLLIFNDLSYEEVLPELIDRLQILSYQATPYLCCFHGAAVEYKKTILLMPGKSGKGKSTLCAELLHFGGKLYSDEFIVLDEKNNLLPIKLPVAIKTGSWDILVNYYPELPTVKSWKRLDGRQVKYIWPNRQEIGHVESSKMNTRIIFPNYNANINFQANIGDLSVIDTINGLTAGGYQIANDLNEETIDKLITYIQKSKRTALHYSRSEQAFELLGYQRE